MCKTSLQNKTLRKRLNIFIKELIKFWKTRFRLYILVREASLKTFHRADKL